MRLTLLPAIAAAFAAGLLSGCSGTPSDPPATVAPPVEVDLTAADPDAAAKLHELIERAVRAPEDATFRGELGMAYSINGYQLAAMKSYEQATELDPTNPQWSYLLALTKASSGDLEGALTAMRTSIEVDPTYVSSHLYVGQWSLDLGRAEESERALREALELDPLNRAGLLLLGRAMFRQGRNTEVIQMLEKLTEERPGDAYLFHLLGTAYRFQGEMDKAKIALAKGKVEVDGLRWNDPWSEQKLKFMAGYGADMLQAEALLTAGRTAEAIAVFEALRMKRPDDLQMLNNLSVAYRRDGQEAKSLEVLEKGVEAHPDYFPFHMNLATAYERSGDSNRALEHLDAVTELNPSLGEAYRRKGQILIRQERLEEALEAYESALSYESGDPINFLYAGTIAAKVGQCDRSIRWLETATRMQPDLVPALLVLGECRARVGDFIGAEMALNRVAEIAPDLKGLAAKRKLVAELQSDQP